MTNRHLHPQLWRLGNSTIEGHVRATLHRARCAAPRIAIVFVGVLATGLLSISTQAAPDAPEATHLQLDQAVMRLATLPVGTAGMMAEYIQEDAGQVYLLGGYRAGAAPGELDLSRDVLRYDAVHDDMSKLGELPIGLALAAHVYVPDQGLIYLLGGIEASNGQPLASSAIRTYDVNTGELATLAATLSTGPRSRAAAVYVRSLNQIFVFGGVAGTQAASPASSPPVTSVERLDLATGVANTVAMMPAPGVQDMTWVSAHAVSAPYPAVLHPEDAGAVTVLASSYILVLGDHGYAVFDPATHTFLASGVSLEVNDIVGAATTFVPGQLSIWSAGGYGARAADIRCWKTEAYATHATLPRPAGAEGTTTLAGIPLSGDAVIPSTQNDGSAVYVPRLDRVLFFGGFMAPVSADSDIYCGENRWPDRPDAATYSRSIYAISPEYSVAPPQNTSYHLRAVAITNPVVGADVSVTVENDFGEPFAVAVQAAYRVDSAPDSVEMRIVNTVNAPPNTQSFPVTIVLPSDLSPGPEQPDRSPLLRGKQVIGVCLLSLLRTSLPPNCREVAVSLRPGALQGVVTRDMTGAGQPGTVAPVSGATVELRDAGNDLVDTRITGPDGAYSFCAPGEFCLAVGDYTLNVAKAYASGEFPTPESRLVHLPRAIPVDILASQVTPADLTLQVTKVLGPTVRTLHAEHNALLGDEIGTFLAFDHLRGKGGVPSIPVVMNTFSIQTQDFTGDDVLNHPEFRTGKVTFELNGVVQVVTAATDGAWNATFDMSAVLHAGDNTLRVTASDRQSPVPSQTTRDFTVKAIPGKPTDGQISSYVNLFSLEWSSVQETYTTKIRVPSGFRWPDSPPHELNLILLKLYSQMRADIEIHEEYAIAGGWNAEGEGGMKLQLLSLKPDEFQMDDEFTVTPSYDAGGIAAYVVRSQRFDLCTLKLPKCGEWVPIYGKEFRKEFSKGRASLTLTLNLSLSAQYAASLVLQGTLRGDNWRVAEIRMIPRTELGLKANGEASAVGEFKMPAFIPDISFTVSAGAEAEARLFYDQPIVYNPDRASPVYLDDPCIRFLARAQAWLDLPSPVPDLETGWWKIVDEAWPDNCFVDDDSVALLWAAAATQGPPAVMPAPVIAIAPDRHATLRVWIEPSTSPSGATLTTLTYQAQIQGQGAPATGAVLPGGAIADPALLFVTNDTALAVWSQFDAAAAVGDTTNLADLFKSQEVYAAFWSATAGWTAPTRLTSNNVGDGRPVIATHPATGRAVVAWVRDPDATAGTAGDLQIVARAWDGAAWSAESLVAPNNGSANTEPAIAYAPDGAEAWLVWVRDHDANFNTNEDRRLNYAIWNGSQWAAPVEPAGWPGGAFSPDLVFSPLSRRPLVTMVVRGRLGDASQGTDLGPAGIGNENRLYAAWWGSAAAGWDVDAVGDTRAERPQAMLVSDDRGLILLRDFGGGEANGLRSGAGQVGAAEGELNPDGARWALPGVLTHSDIPIWQVSGASVPLNSASDGDFGLNFVAVTENRDQAVGAAAALAPGAPAAIATVGMVRAVNLGGTTATGVIELQPATNGVDLAIDAVQASNLLPVPGEVVTLSVRVRSTTLRPMSEAGNTRVQLFLYVDTSLTGDYLDLAEYNGELLFNESAVFTLRYRSAGRPEEVTLRVDYDGDLDTSNDTYLLNIGTLPGPQSVQVHEGEVVYGSQLHANKASLTWAPPTLEAGRFWSYRIYRGPTEMGPWRLYGFATHEAYVDVTPAPDELYYAVEAYDEYNRRSEQSVVTLARFAPVAMADILAVPQNLSASVEVLLNDSDKDGDPLKVMAVTQGQHGMVTTDGIRVSYTPQGGYVGGDSFNYTVGDEKEGTADAPVTVEVLPPAPALSINDLTVDEGSGNATFTVTADRAINVNMEATFVTSDGTAGLTGDYSTATGTVTVKSGTTSALIIVPIADDGSDENDESFTVMLSQPVNATIADGQGVAVIVDNDGVGAANLYLPSIRR